MKIKVLVINLGWEQQPLIDELLKLEYELYGITNDNSNNLLTTGFKEVHVVDYRDLDRIYQIALKIRPNAVISDQCDYSHYAQAYLCERLNLNGPSLRQAQVSSNKYIQRKIAQKNGINVPHFELATSLAEAKEIVNNIGLPVIIKPIDNRGSFGISKINSVEDIKEAYYNALVNSHSRFILIEKFIEGYEITVDGYCFNGKPKSISVALKSKEGLKSQVSMDIKYPADIPSSVYEKALLNNELVANALGYTFGMIHSEYIINDRNEIFLVESANRGGGVFTSELIVPKVSGVNILNLYIDDVLGINSNIDLTNVIQRNQVILKFFSFKNGRVKKIQGLDIVSNSTGVLACRLNIKVGDNIKSIENDGSRHGFIIYSSLGNIREEVAGIINKINITYYND